MDAPNPVIRKVRWRFSLVWLVPVIAAAATGYWLFEYRQKLGPEITITFDEINGLYREETRIRHRGVEIGRVTFITLSDDHQHAVVNARLYRDYAALACNGSQFWIVRPQISVMSITGLNTLISGPYIEVLPGNGKPSRDFKGLATAPIDTPADQKGLHIVMHTDRLDHLELGSPVYYRGIDVGLVKRVAMSPDAKGVDIDVLIRPRYTTLIRQNTKFWSVSGAAFKAGLFSGVNLRVESVRSMISGGIALATPDNAGPPAENGTVFYLNKDGDEDWLEWSPTLPLPPETTDDMAAEQ